MANNSKTRTLFAFTSPRTIEKIIPEIKLLGENYSGKVWSGNQELQSEFFDQLFTSDFYEGENYPSDPAFAARDRMTRAPKALGFIELKPKILITEVGDELLKSKRKDEVITRQLLKFQLPSYYHKNFPVEFSVRPYLELLRLVRVVGNLSKIEIALFFTQLTHYNKFENICEKIKLFRHQSKGYKGSWRTYVEECFNREILEIYDDEIKSKQFKTRESSEISITKFIMTKKHNMLDYADAFVRYLRATQLITFQKKTFRIIASSAKMEEIDYILKNIPRDPIKFSTEKEFKAYLFSSSNLTLLYDNKELLIQKLNKLKIKTKKDDITIEELKDVLETTVIKIKQDVIEQKVKELKDYKDFDEVLDVFEQIIRRRVPDPPLFFEWNVWRALEMINYAKQIDGNFSIDLEGMPLNTAPGNKPDIEALYDGFDLIVEVTLSSGNTQYKMENESVPRHFGVKKTQSKQELYCLFIAPSISSGTLAHYFNLNKMNTKFYGGKTKIIPMTIEDFIRFLVVAKEHKFSDPVKLKSFLEELWIDNQSCKDEVDWYKKISEKVSAWAA